MPYISVGTTPKGGNKGSSSNYANYLEKENEKGISEEKFFSHSAEGIEKEEVIQSIDSNKAKLGKDDAKFYSVTIAPSKNELKAMGKTEEQQIEALKEYTRDTMDEYAKNFNREGVKDGNDLVYYAKIEKERKYRGTDQEVKNGQAKSGDLKPGNNLHAHVIVSRKDRENKKKLSPMANEKGGNNSMLNGKKVQRGFDRSNFKQKGEENFDKKFNYDRPLEQSYQYHNTMKNGTTQQKETMLGMDKIQPKKELSREEKLALAREKREQRLEEQRNQNKSKDRGLGL